MAGSDSSPNGERNRFRTQPPPSEEDARARFTPPIPRVALLLASLVVGLWGLEQAAPLLIPLLLASLLALLLSPLVRRLRALHVPEPLALAFCALVLLIPLSSLGFLILHEIQALIADFPHILATTRQKLAAASSGGLLHRLLPQPVDSSALLEKAAGQGGQAMQFALSTLGTVLGAGSQLVTVLLFTILILAARTNLRRSAGRLLHRTRAPAHLVDELVDLMQLFLVARFLIVGIVGAVDTGILLAGGVRYAVLLGGFLGVTTLIPAVGFFIALVPTLLVMAGMGLSLGHVILVTAALAVVSIVEGNVLTPRMVGRRMNINTLSTFVGLFAGGLLWGTWGMFLSIPILGTLQIVLSVVPELDDWSALLAAREDRSLALRLRRRRPRQPWHLRH